MGLGLACVAAQAQCVSPVEMWSVDLCKLDTVLSSDFGRTDFNSARADVFYVADGAFEGTINSVSWVGLYTDERGVVKNSPLGPFTVSFFNTQNGHPLGSPIASFVVTPTRSEGQYSTWVRSQSSGLKPLPLIVFEAALPSTLKLAPGGFTKPYAISIVADTRQDPNANFRWAATTHPVGFTNSYSGNHEYLLNGDPRFGWSPVTAGDPAFRLSAQLPTPPIPEPGTWAMMALGLAGLSAVARRRQAKA